MYIVRWGEDRGYPMPILCVACISTVTLVLRVFRCIVPLLGIFAVAIGFDALGQAEDLQTCLKGGEGEAVISACTSVITSGEQNEAPEEAGRPLNKGNG